MSISTALITGLKALLPCLKEVVRELQTATWYKHIRIRGGPFDTPTEGGGGGGGGGGGANPVFELARIIFTSGRARNAQILGPEIFLTFQSQNISFFLIFRVRFFFQKKGIPPPPPLNAK